MTSFYDQFKNLSKRKINEAFVQACEAGELDKVKYLLASPELNANANFKYKQNLAFKVAFRDNHTDIVKYFITDIELKKYVDTDIFLLGFLNMACKKKDTVWLEELLPLAVKNRPNAISNLVDNCCNDGNLDMFKYLVDSPIWSEKVTNEINSIRFQDVCASGNVEFIEYLLNSQWKSNIDIHADKDKAFINCCNYEAIEAIKYFIFNLKIPKSSYIEEYLNEFPYEFNNKVIKMFDVRDLNESLENQLEPNEKSNRKPNKL
jgi:hypothetical protein